MGKLIKWVLFVAIPLLFENADISFGQTQVSLPLQEVTGHYSASGHKPAYIPIDLVRPPPPTKADMLNALEEAERNHGVPPDKYTRALVENYKELEAKEKLDEATKTFMRDPFDPEANAILHGSRGLPLRFSKDQTLKDPKNYDLYYIEEVERLYAQRVKYLKELLSRHLLNIKRGYANFELGQAVTDSTERFINEAYYAKVSLDPAEATKHFENADQALWQLTRNVDHPVDLLFNHPFGFGLNSFPTEEAAASTVLKNLNPVSKRGTSNKHSGVIYWNHFLRGYSYSSPLEGNAYHMADYREGLVPIGISIVATYRTHGSLVLIKYKDSGRIFYHPFIEFFSRQDRALQDGYGIPGYLITPGTGGIRRYDPDLAQGGNGRVSTVLPGRYDDLEYNYPQLDKMYKNYLRYRDQGQMDKAAEALRELLKYFKVSQ